MPASWHGIIASVIASFVMAVFWVAPHALAEDDIDNDVILGALIAEFHISVAASLSSDALTAETPLSGETIIDAAQLIVLSGITDKPANANEADLGKALDAFLAFAATLDKEKLPPLSPKFATLLACQLIGADPIAHAALGATLKIDAKGAEACAEDFAQAIIKWNKRFAPYRRDADVTPPDGAGLLYVEIAPVIDETNEAIAESLRQSGLFDKLAESLNAAFALPYGRVLLVTECGGPNIFFNPDRREIVLCDERIAAWIAVQRKETNN